MSVAQQSIDMALTGLGVMAQDDKESLVDILSQSGSLADETMSSQQLLDLSLKAIQDSPKFRALLSNYFTQAVEQSMKSDIGASFSGNEDFFSADGEDDEEIVDIYGDAMRNADGDDDEEMIDIYSSADGDDDEEMIDIYSSADGDDDEEDDDEANMDGEEDDDDEASDFSGNEDFFNLVDDEDAQEEVIDDEMGQPSFSGNEDFFSADGDDDEEMIDIYN